MRYIADGDTLWLEKDLPQGPERTQLTNFIAEITAEIMEDDGAHTPQCVLELEVTQGARIRTLRLSAKDFAAMTWIAEVLGATGRVIPGPFHKEHAHAAIQELSTAIDSRTTYIHIGWRLIDRAWSYLHAGGAITAQGERKDISVALAPPFERYRLPAPLSGPEAQEALRASLALRTVGPDQIMQFPLAMAYLAPLRELLPAEPPDFVLWILGQTGSYKSEYTALALAHFGDFTRQTLPGSFEATGNGLERLLHTPKDSLMVVDDLHPAESRKEADAMAQVASRLLRSMGNQSSRQRMKRDTTMQDQLPPRCVAVSSGELVPSGHSNNARMFLAAMPPLTKKDIQYYGKLLEPHQAGRARLPQAMSVYLQWLAQHFAWLAAELPARYAALRQVALEEGCHAREPSQIAYLQLAWETFTQCAVDCGAISLTERDTILSETTAKLVEAAEAHAAVLQREQPVERFFAYLRAGLASKRVYLRSTDDATPEDPGRWGWTPTAVWNSTANAHIPVHEPRQALLLGYVDATWIWLIPKTLEQYLHQAAREENRPWSSSMITLLWELDSVHAIRTTVDNKGHVRREPGKKIQGGLQRMIWLHQRALFPPEEAGDEPGDEDIPFVVST